MDNTSNRKLERIQQNYLANKKHFTNLLDNAKSKNDQSGIKKYSWYLKLLENEYQEDLKKLNAEDDAVVETPVCSECAEKHVKKQDTVQVIEQNIVIPEDSYVAREKKNKITKKYERQQRELLEQEDYYKSVYDNDNALGAQVELQRLEKQYQEDIESINEWARNNPNACRKSNTRKGNRYEQERNYRFNGTNEEIEAYLEAQYNKKRKRERAPAYIKPLGQIKNDEDILVKMRDVRIAFKIGNVERVIIEKLNLDIKRGEILGLVGESGSGKTTVGRAIIRVNNVSDGVIAYNNVPISGKIPHIRERALKTKVQMVFQDPAASLNERANVDYIISEGLRAFRMYTDEEDRLKKVHQILEDVGLRPEHLTRYPHEFSGGQRQRIGIARCMVMNPEFVIADEPISALDVSIRAQVLNLLKGFQKDRKMTILFIAHDLSVVRYISDRIAVIYAGKIVELCEANRLFSLPLHAYTKALLSAVPVPDPKIERNKKITTYNPSIHEYTKDDIVELREVEEGHFVRCNEAEYQKCLELARKGGK